MTTVATSQCSQCEQSLAWTPPRQCAAHGNEYGIVLPHDILRQSGDQLLATVVQLRHHRAEAGPVRRGGPTGPRVRVAPPPLNMDTLTAEQAALAIVRGQLTVAEVLGLVAEGKIALEDLQRVLG